MKTILYKLLVVFALVPFILSACSPQSEVTQTSSTEQVEEVAQSPEATQPASTEVEVEPTSEQVMLDEESDKLIEVIIVQDADPQSLDPQKPGGQFGGNLTFNIFNGLTYRTADMSETLPSLATEWRLIDDLTWEFKLREGVMFQNGEMMTAEAVKYTVDRMLMPDAVRALYSFGTLDHAEVIDDYTVRIITKTPDPILPDKVFDLQILPPVYTEEVGEKGFSLAPIGAGPYKLVEFSPNQQIVLEKFEDYWGEKPTVDRLIFKPVPEQSTRLAEVLAGTGDIVLSLVAEDIPTIEKSQIAHVQSASGKRVAYIGMDLLPIGPEFLKDKRVRQALNYAVDKQAIIDTIIGGFAQQVATIYRPDFVGYDPDLDPYPYDPDKAKALLAEAGYDEGEISLKITTSTGMTTKAIEVAEAIVAMLQDVGIDAQVNTVEYQQQRDMYIGGQEAHNVDALFVWNWGSRDSSATAPLNGMLASKGISSYVRDPILDEMILAADSAMDLDQRIQLNKEVQAYIFDQAYCIYLWLVEDVYGVNNKIQWSPRRDQYVLGTEITVIP